MKIKFSKKDQFAQAMYSIRDCEMDIDRNGSHAIRSEEQAWHIINEYKPGRRPTRALLCMYRDAMKYADSLKNN